MVKEQLFGLALLAATARLQKSVCWAIGGVVELVIHLRLGSNTKNLWRREAASIAILLGAGTAAGSGFSDF